MHHVRISYSQLQPHRLRLEYQRISAHFNPPRPEGCPRPGGDDLANDPQTCYHASQPDDAGSNNAVSLLLLDLLRGRLDVETLPLECLRHIPLPLASSQQGTTP